MRVEKNQNVVFDEKGEWFYIYAHSYVHMGKYVYEIIIKYRIRYIWNGIRSS